MAIPTGLIFVRLVNGISFDNLTNHFHRAGYDIAKTLAYAPNAGWLRQTSDSISKSLTGLNKLAKISGVENVEPQMLMRSTKRK